VRERHTHLERHTQRDRHPLRERLLGDSTLYVNSREDMACLIDREKVKVLELEGYICKARNALAKCKLYPNCLFIFIFYIILGLGNGSDRI